MNQPTHLFRGDSDPASQENFLRAADQIGSEFLRDSVWSGDRCNWMTWSLKPVDGQFLPSYGACGLSLYDGLAGIALFLVRLAKHTQDPHQAAVAWGALRQILRDGETLDAPGTRGFYSGLGGVAYTLAIAGDVLESDALIEKGLTWLVRAAAVEQEYYDILSGAAGLIAPLIDLAHRFDRPDLLDLAEAQAKSLVRTAVEGGSGVSWKQPGGAGPNLLGYSHGTAGIACALLEIDQLRSDRAYRETAIRALEYERAHFNPVVSNWPDLREQATNPIAAPGYPVAWCHGAGGVGFSRLRILELLKDEKLLPEVDAALRCVSAELATPKTAADFSYCHGMAGNAEFLLEVALQQGRGDIRAAAMNVGQFGIDRYQSRGVSWPCGLHGAGEVRGLMPGIAGIGHFYLRLHNAADVPGVLLVRPKAEPDGVAAGGAEQAAYAL